VGKLGKAEGLLEVGLLAREVISHSIVLLFVSGHVFRRAEKRGKSRLGPAAEVAAPTPQGLKAHHDGSWMACLKACPDTTRSIRVDSHYVGIS